MAVCVILNGRHACPPSHCPEMASAHKKKSSCFVCGYGGLGNICSECQTNKRSTSEQSASHAASRNSTATANEDFETIDKTIAMYMGLVRSKLELLEHMRTSEFLGTQGNIDDAVELAWKNLCQIQAWIMKEKELKKKLSP